MRSTGVLLACAVGLGLLGPLVPRGARGQAVCESTPVPLERQLRQLYLDLLARPPTVDEYSAQRSKGSIDETDIRALLTREERRATS